MSIILFNKPFGVLSQFSGDGNTLKKYIKISGIYPAGRLDKDSEGLMILTNDGVFQHQISHPKFNKEKTYLVQVDNLITLDAIEKLSNGLELKDGLTKPAKVKIIDEPKWLWQRNPPIRVRKNIPTSWIEISISEGKNRQIRRMCGFIGFPALRLVRIKIGNFELNNLKVGEFRKL